MRLGRLFATSVAWGRVLVSTRFDYRVLMRIDQGLPQAEEFATVVHQVCQVVVP